MKLEKLLFGSSAALFLAAAPVLGHGVQIQITFDLAAAKIKTGQVVHSNSAASPVPFYARGDAIAPPARVYVMPLLDSQITAGNGYYTRPTDYRNPITQAPQYPSGPGLSWRYEYQTAGTGWSLDGSTTLPNLRNSQFTIAFTDAFKSWNGSAFVDPGTEQFQAFAGDGTGAFVPGTTPDAVTSDAGPFDSMTLSAINPATPPAATSIPHSSVSFRLLGDGVDPAAPSDDGIYLASLKLSSSAVFGAGNTPVGDSDPFYFVMYKGSTLDEAMNVANAFAVANNIPLDQVQAAVPEPGSLAAAGAVAALAARRRRQA
jgi:hypothetical protein